MTTKIKVGEFFYTTGSRQFFCCDELQDVIYCEAHDEPQGCQYCDFDYDTPCQC